MSVPAQRTAALARPTPTGVLVYDGEPHTPEWYEARLAGITATDLVKIMGRSDYGNARSVWMNKRGELPEDPAGEAAWWGLAHEPKIAERWSDQHGTSVASVGVLAHEDHLHHRASLDGLVLRCPDGDGPCGVQYKCRSAFKAGQWRHDVPDDVYVQEQWECHVAGFRHMHVACLLGGNHLVPFRVDRDDDDLAILVEAAEDVWARVCNGEPPVVRPDDLLLRILAARYPNRAGQRTLDEQQALTLRSRWLAARGVQRTADAAARVAKTAVEAVTAELVDALGPAEAAFVDGYQVPAFTYAERSRQGYVVADKTYRQMEITDAFTKGE